MPCSIRSGMMTRDTRYALAKEALRAAKRARIKRVETAKEFRDLTDSAGKIGEWDKLGGEGKITLNVLNVAGDLACG